MVGDAAQINVRMENRSQFMKGLSKELNFILKAQRDHQSILSSNDMIKFKI